MGRLFTSLGGKNKGNYKNILWNKSWYYKKLKFDGGASMLTCFRINTPHLENLIKQTHAVIEYTRCHVKIKSKLTNLKINSQIEGYNDK